MFAPTGKSPWPGQCSWPCPPVPFSGKGKAQRRAARFSPRPAAAQPGGTAAAARTRVGRSSRARRCPPPRRDRARCPQRERGAVPACPLPPGSRVPLAGTAGLFNTRAVISRTAAHRRGWGRAPLRRVCKARGDWQPRGAATSRRPRAQQPPPPLGGAREGSSGPHMRSKPWQGECYPTEKGAGCFASASPTPPFLCKHLSVLEKKYRCSLYSGKLLLKI